MVQRVDLARGGPPAETDSPVTDGTVR